MSHWINLTASDGHQLDAYLAEPAAAPKGAVVVLQEIFGVNAHIRSVADRFAAEGYLALAPALFDRFGKGIELTYQGEDRARAMEYAGKRNPELQLLDVAAAFRQVSASGIKVGAVGFCYGGLLAWLTATRARSLGITPACTVGYYAGGIGKVASEEPTCPVMLHFGADDSHIGSDQLDAVRNAHAGHSNVQLFVYAAAGHAFNRDVDPQAFVPEAAALANERTLAFLAENLA